MHVLLVDDEPRMVELVAGYLATRGESSVRCHDGPGALEAARRPEVDVVVLDVMLPGMDGVEVCRRLRREGNDVPVLLLTARGAVAERVTGLEAGADDYLVKPFALEELHARLRVMHRRGESDAGRVAVGDVLVDTAARRVWVAGDEVALTRREYAMLAALVESRGRVVSRSRLFDAVWDDETDVSSNALDVHVSRLRNRLATSRSVSITTLRGVGYRLDERPG